LPTLSPTFECNSITYLSWWSEQVSTFEQAVRMFLWHVLSLVLQPKDKKIITKHYIDLVSFAAEVLYMHTEVIVLLLFCCRKLMIIWILVSTARIFWHTIFMGTSHLSKQVTSATVLADRTRMDVRKSLRVTDVPDSVCCLFLFNSLACLLILCLGFHISHIEPAGPILLIFLQQQLLGDSKEQSLRSLRSYSEMLQNVAVTVVLSTRHQLVFIFCSWRYVISRTFSPLSMWYNTVFLYLRLMYL